MHHLLIFSMQEILLSLTIFSNFNLRYLDFFFFQSITLDETFFKDEFLKTTLKPLTSVIKSEVLMKVSTSRASFQEEVRCARSNMCCPPQCVSCLTWSLMLSCLLFSIFLLIYFPCQLIFLHLKESCLIFKLGIPQIGLLQECHFFGYIRQIVLIRVCHFLYVLYTHAPPRGWLFSQIWLRPFQS